MRIRERLSALSATAFSVVAVAVVGAAFAADPPKPAVALAYTRDVGADACPDEATLHAGVAARLGYDPFSPTAKSKVRARIWKQGNALRATIDVLDENGGVKGSRELTSSKNDCEELASAMTLTISMVIDPLGKPPVPTVSATTTSASTSAEPPPVLRPPPPPPVTSTSVDAPRPPPSTKSEARPRRFRVSAGGFGALGIAPRVDGGVSGGFGIELANLSLDLEGRRDWPVTAALGRGNATTSLVAASVVPCVHRGVGVLCAVVTAGSLQASGGGVDQPTNRSALFLGAGLRAGVEWTALDALAIYARVEVISPLIHATIRLDGDDVWSSPPVAGSLGAGLVAFF